MKKASDNIKAEKADLSVGYLVETRDGRYGLVCAKKDFEMFIALYESNRGFNLELYHDDLIVKSPWKHDLDIMKIYGNPRMSEDFITLISTESRDLLWERKERKKMTLDEIEEALGYEIELVNPAEDANPKYPMRACKACSGCEGCQACKDMDTYDESCCDHKEDCPKKGERE